MNDNLNEQSTIEQETTGGSQMPGFGVRMHGRSGFGGMQPQGNMWGNESFAGEDMLSSNNFASQNFGAPGDLSGIVDTTTSADISVNIGEQNNFGNFPQGGVTFGKTDGQGMNFRPSNRMQAR